MLRSAAPIWNGRGSLGMTKEMLWLLMGHLVCIGQWAAFIMVDHAFLGRGRRFRFPCLWAALLAAVFLVASIRHDIGFFNIGSVHPVISEYTGSSFSYISTFSAIGVNVSLILTICSTALSKESYTFAATAAQIAEPRPAAPFTSLRTIGI